MQLEVCECEKVEVDEEEWMEENGLSFPLFYSPPEHDRYYALLDVHSAVSVDFLGGTEVAKNDYHKPTRYFTKLVELCYDKHEGTDLSNVKIISRGEFMDQFDRAVNGIRGELEEVIDGE